MAKVTKPENARRALSGAFVIRDTKWGPVVASYPRKRSRPPSPYEVYHRGEFGLAGSLAAHPFSLDVAFAESWAKGTNMVPRDILTMLAMGTFFIFEGDDCPPFQSWRHMSNNPQYWLDLITDVPGTVIWRSEEGWVGIPPGNSGDILTIVAGIPQWLPNTGAAGAPAQWTMPPLSGVSGSAYATKGGIIEPAVPTTIQALSAYMTTVAGASYSMSIWTLSGYSLDTLIGLTDTLIPSSAETGPQEFALPDPVTLAADTPHAILLSRTDASDTYVLPVYGSTDDFVSWLGRKVDTYLTLAKASPTTGDALGHGAHPYNVGMKYAA